MNLTERYRAPHPFIEKITGDVTGGYFVIPHPTLRRHTIRCLASNDVWQRAAVTVGKAGSKPTRCPTWEEMGFVKSLFWDAEECVVQFHPPQSQYVNNHPYCLWLWRHRDYEYQTPPSELVGIK